MTDAEPEFNEHVEEQQEAINKALNELTKVRAYSLAPDELKDLKAAQYALRNLSMDKDGGYYVAEVYDDEQ